VRIDPLAPPLVNDARVTQIAKEVTKDLFPGLEIDNTISMGSEDMALMMESIPSCYMMVGSRDAERGLDAPHHNPRFNFSEEVLPKTAAIIAATTWRLLEQK
jgi:amidohydrolase